MHLPLVLLCVPQSKNLPTPMFNKSQYSSSPLLARDTNSLTAEQWKFGADGLQQSKQSPETAE